MRSSDWGVYHCSAYNDLGDSTKAITLTGKTEEPLHQQYLGPSCALKNLCQRSWPCLMILCYSGQQQVKLLWIFLLNYLWSNSCLLTIEFVLDNTPGSEWYILHTAQWNVSLHTIAAGSPGKPTILLDSSESGSYSYQLEWSVTSSYLPLMHEVKYWPAVSLSRSSPRNGLENQA